MSFATAHAPSPGLDVLGVTPAEAYVYHMVRDWPDATLAQLAARLPFPFAKVRSLLASLEAKGRVVCPPQQPRRYRPLTPRTAAEVRIAPNPDTPAPPVAGTLPAPIEPMASPAPLQEPPLNILDNRDAILRAIAQVQRMATRECLCLDKPPYVSGPPDTVDRGEAAALARGVDYRTLIDMEAFNFPGVAERVRISVEAGAQVRLGSKLPLKMLIADGGTGLIPMNLQDPGGPVLRLGASSLLDALRTFFELLWQAATPLTLSRSGELKMASSTVKLPVDIDQLIPRLAAGVNDKTIAHDLGLSPRTFDRRIDEFMKNLNARTRFQAGWLAAHRFSARAEQ